MQTAGMASVPHLGHGRAKQAVHGPGGGGGGRGGGAHAATQGQALWRRAGKTQGSPCEYV